MYIQNFDHREEFRRYLYLSRKALKKHQKIDYIYIKEYEKTRKYMDDLKKKRKDLNQKQIEDSRLLNIISKIQYCLRNHTDYREFERDSNGYHLVFEIPFDLAFNINEDMKHDSDYKACIRVLEAKRQRVRRLRKRISLMLECGKCAFVTLTFRDEIFETKDSTRRQYVRRFLQHYTDVYIANIDFGSEKGREHYHAIVLQSEPDDDFKWIKEWSFGYSDYKIIFNSSRSVSSLSEYVDKLVNHAKKESTHGSRIIYSNIPVNWDPHIDGYKWDYKTQSLIKIKQKEYPKDKQLNLLYSWYND